jgi:hypothetical protein
VSSHRRSFLLKPNSQRIQPTASLPADTRQQTTGFQGIRISMSRPSGIESNLRLATILPPKSFNVQVEDSEALIGCRVATRIPQHRAYGRSSGTIRVPYCQPVPRCQKPESVHVAY